MPVFPFKPPNIPSIPSIQNSIQNYRPRRKQPKQSKSNTSLHASPFGVRRVLPPGSPHPYASEDVVDISEQNTWSSTSLNAESTSVIEDAESGRSVPSITFQPLRSPTMKLEIEVSGELELSDWIPAHLLSSDSEAYTNSTTANTPEASNSNPRPESPVRNVEDDEDTASSVGSEDIVAGLKAMKASDFVNLTEHEDDQRLSSLAKSKRNAPAPIRIPTLDMTRPKVQLVRSSSTSNISPTPPRSRPASLISLDEPSASAVSGRTLARALIGNSFALSNDRRTSRYRSGTSILTRSDSATLPFGEHPFYNFTRENDTFSPGSRGGSIIPPVPPLPELYTSPTRSAGSRNRTPDGRLDTKTIESVMTPPPGEEDLADPEPISISFKRSRVSKISEANSSELSTPSKSADGSSQNLIPPPLNLEPETPASRPTSQLASPQDSLNAPSSTTRSSGSLENVLDYYQLESSPGLVVPPPPPLPPGAFQPIFTPITEESSSQLSPPAPYKGNDSPRKVVLGVSSSPISEAKRIDFTSLTTSPRRQSRDGSLLPIGARPRSQFATAPTADLSKPGSIITSLAALDVLGPLAPPPISTLFHRERAGSIPSPIQVTRDEHDLNTYNLTITPGPDASPGSTPSTEGAQFARQTFPETPNAFSPGFTPSSAVSPGIPVTDIQMPQTPKSATLPGKGTMMPSLAQQVLLTRAATSVRHSRQNSLSRSRPAAQLNQGYSINEDVEEDSIVNHEGSQTSEEVSREVPIASSPSAVAQMFPDTAPPSPPSPPSPPPATVPLSNPPSSPSVYSVTDGVTVTNPTAVVAAASSSSCRSHPFRSRSESSVEKDLPPKSPRKMGVHAIPVPPQPTGSPPLPPQGRRTPQRPRTPPQRTHTPPQIPTPLQRVPPPLTAVQPLTPVITPGEPQVSTAADSDAVVTPPALLPPSPQSISSQQHNRVEREPESPTHINFPGSPPPYDSVFHHNHTEQYVSAAIVTPTSAARSASAVDSQFGLSPGFSPASPDRNRTSSGRRGRMRPPLPAGPRRPSNQFEHSRARNGSVTSLASTGASSRRGVAPVLAPLPSPRFHTPSVRWRGYTMDAAKWTFSSAQLQTIVSRAIKQSAEASSIRLLRLDTLDHDIPAEVRRLEMHRTDVKAKYKMLSRRRAEILGQLASYVEGTKVEEFAIAARLVDDLKECSVALDKLAEDLHSADEQLSQLRSLCEVHSSSALAMALRKLNASFLRQLAEAQSLREQVGTLEAERDEAWKQAESLANEYDNLHEKTRTEPVDNFSKRSSRVIASRKSSIRFSKAGLRSARSSMSSFRMSQSIPSGSRSAFSIEDVPPVPPIPRRRPRDIITDLPARSSAGMSTDGFTPNSETRAMIRAHEELCEMLGIMETRTRRTRSFVVHVRDDRDSSSSGLAVASTSSRPRSNTSSGRPTSLPSSARLSEVYDSVMDADRHAMLATLEMLADHE